MKEQWQPAMQKITVENTLVIKNWVWVQEKLNKHISIFNSHRHLCCILESKDI